MFCAFRLYGDFVWPPRPDAADGDDKRQGLVEIYFAHFDPPGAEAGRLRAFLRWRPGTVVPVEGEAAPLPEHNIFDIDKPHEWFAEQGKNPLSVWIHGYDGEKGGEVLAFRGAFLFEQPAALDGSIPRLRWPLVRSASYGKGLEGVLSELVIGQPRDPRHRGTRDNFRFNLQLPTLLPQTRIKGEAVPVFPFSVLYESDVATDAAAIRFDTLTVGPGGADIMVSAINEPADERLGAFGFAPRRGSAGKDFAGYDDASSSALDHFWPPTDEAGPCLSLLGAIGIDTAAPSAGRPKLARDTPAEMSFRPGFDAESGKNQYVSRFTFIPPSGKGSAGDLFWEAGTFYLRLEEEIGGFLKLGQPHLDCILEFDIADKTIWASEGWPCKIRLRPHWQSDLRRAVLGEVPTEIFNTRPAYSAGTLPDGAQAMRLALADLYRVEAAQPQSFLPDLAVPFGQKPRFALYAPPLQAELDAAGAVSFVPRPPVTQRTPLRLTLLDNHHLIAPEEKQELALEARLPNFFTHGTPTLPFILGHDRDWASASDWQEVIEAQDQPYFASFTISATGQEGAADRIDWLGRLSSIEFAAHAAPLDYGAGRLRLAGRGVGNRGLNTAPRVPGYPHPIAACVKFDLPFTGAVPLGVDLRRGVDVGRTAPILIDTGASVEAGEGEGARFRLAIEEYLAPVGDRLMTAEVFEDTVQTGDKTYIVISEEPFSINRFSSRVLGGRGDAASASVAFYSSARRVWEFRQVADTYRYSFPPQAIGESADKPRRLEIHDLPADAATNGAGPPERPYRHDPSQPEDSLRRRAVEFRLTPSAEIWIRPSDVERGYFMPEWNSHDIFRQRGERGLGAALAWLRAEFLYGLPVGIEVGKERGFARRARVAEIEALTGSPLATADIGSPLAARWNALSTAIARRPERLEVWADDPASMLDFAPARFSDGATFALRETALLRAPVLRTGEAEPAESEQHYRDLPRQRGRLRYHPQGLSGGALWPVESANLFDALANSPLAGGGEIENIALSPLGGDAAQKALFLDGKVTIITRTRNGFIERQQVEVTGRIGALWHRAKHVVVYERTVNPSAQFAPSHAQDPDRTRTRRPVLRKVREYIELLQPERSYPDFAQASARSAGFLDRVRFNARIINVDSAWGRDIGQDCWEVPLWNRRAARQRPQVYPMPDIAFVSVAEGEGERPLVAQECRDPDNLYFFADFKAPGADTDAWPVHLGVDYANLPSAAIIAKVHDSRSEAEPGAIGNAERRRPPVSRVLPGMRRFTWRLAASPRKVALNAGRSATPLYVGLDSISFMRAGQEGGKADLFAPFAELLGSSAAAGKAEPAAADYWSADGKGALFDAAADYMTALAGLRSVLVPGTDPAVVAGARDELVRRLESVRGEAAPKIKTLAGSVKETLAPVHKAAGAARHVIDKGKADCDRLKTEALDTVRGKAMLAEALLRDWEADIASVLDMAGLPATKQALVDYLADEIVAAIRPGFEQAAGGVADLGERIEQARAILGDAQAEADAAIARTIARINQHAAAHDRDKPWSDGRRVAFYNGLEAAASGLAGDILALIDEARQRLSTELDDMGQHIAGHLGTALHKLGAGHSQAIQDLATFHGAADKLLASARSALSPILPIDAGGGGRLAALLQTLPDIRQRIETSNASAPTKQKAFAALAALEEGVERITAIASDVATLIDAAARYGDRLDRRLTRAITELNALIETLADEALARAGDITTVIENLAGEAQADAQSALQDLLDEFDDSLAGAEVWAGRYLEKAGEPIDALSTGLADTLLDFGTRLRSELGAVAQLIDNVGDDMSDAVAGAQAMLAPEALLQTVIRQAVIVPRLETMLKPIPADFDLGVLRGEILSRLTDVSTAIAEDIRRLDATAASAVGDVSAICNLAFEGAGTVYDYLGALVSDAETYANKQIDSAIGYVSDIIGATPADIAKALEDLKAADTTIRNLQNDLVRSVETAGAYGSRVLEAAGKLDDGGAMAVPSNILKLYSAATSAPEIAALKADIDRLRANFDELSDVIKSTRATALFDRLGDELKALGLSLPFDGISDRLLPVDLSSCNISSVCRNIGGMQCDRLLKGYKLPQGVRDAVRISHDFDRKQARAWVQVDIDAPMPGRRSLFSLGLFQADFVDMRLTAQVRFEASGDSQEITQTGHGRIGTMVDLVVSGQSIVQFEKFGLNFSKEGGPDIEFDHKNIRLNPAFRFIQDFLLTLFPDEVGGLNVIKQDGIPVGLEHEFALPPLSLNFGTSGVSNIAITNRFQLLAYPDFVLANRFSLSRPERPFIFSIFILGGTGYVQVDAEYRPVENELMVAVEAAAGASAALAFAFGPFSGQVFITLSVALTFRKLLGRPGGGLSVGVVLVIAGYVTVASIVTVGIYLMLRMTYRDNGQIDATGTLSVTIRISRFFKITARANVHYKLRDGKAETKSSAGLGIAAEGRLGEATRKLQAARS